MLVAAAGGTTVLPHVTLVDAGYKGRIYQTHGAATPDFLRLGGAKVEGTVLAASLMLVLTEVPDSVPSKAVALEYINAYEKMYGTKPATFGANVYDAGLLLERAVPEAAKRGKPGTPEFRAALRDALEATKEYVGAPGVYNMTPADHSGFDERGRVLITVKDGNWRLLRDVIVAAALAAGGRPSATDLPDTTSLPPILACFPTCSAAAPARAV